MQPFTCPECGETSAFDPRVESARCPACGFRPPTDGHRGQYLGAMQRHRYEPFLMELLAHWDGTYTPDLGFSLATPEEMQELFVIYRRSLGKELNPSPTRGQVLTFAAAYAHLRRGEVEEAGKHLLLLTSLAPQFGDAWVWLTVATEDPAVRREYLDTALRVEPDHPLARDSLAIAEGEALPPEVRADRKVGLVKCPQCGGRLQAAPEAEAARCPYCAAELGPGRIERPAEAAGQAEHARLGHSREPQAWTETQRAVACQVCGARSIALCPGMVGCAFCGATELLVVDEQLDLEQPDGFLPFLWEEAQALEAVRALQQAGLWGLRGWWLAWVGQEVGWRYFPARLPTTLRNLTLWWAARRFRVASILGVYLPFWIFDGVVDVCWSFGDGVVLPEVVEHRIFENLFFPAVEVPEPAVLQRLCPFDLDRRQAYDPRLPREWPVRVYDWPAEILAGRARDLMLGLAKLQVAEKETLPPGAAPEGRAPSLWVHDVVCRLVLLPVWVALMERRGKHLLALINGQTGRLAFSAMFSRDSHDGGREA